MAVDERAVLGERALAVAALGADPEALAQRQREYLRHRPEELVVGRDVDRAMESEIGVDEGLLVRRLGHPGEGEADLLESAGSAAAAASAEAVGSTAKRSWNSFLR